MNEKKRQPPDTLGSLLARRGQCGAPTKFRASRLSEPNQRMGVIAAGTLVSFLLIVLLSLLCCCCLCRHKDDHK